MLIIRFRSAAPIDLLPLLCQPGTLSLPGHLTTAAVQSSLPRPAQFLRCLTPAVTVAGAASGGPSNPRPSLAADPASPGRTRPEGRSVFVGSLRSGPRAAAESVLPAARDLSIGTDRRPFVRPLNRPLPLEANDLIQPRRAEDARREPPPIGAGSADGVGGGWGFGRAGQQHRDESGARHGLLALHGTVVR